MKMEQLVSLEAAQTQITVLKDQASTMKPYI
jgi:hypothetical protein